MSSGLGTVELVTGIVALLVIAALVRALSKWLRLPYTVMLVAAGAGDFFGEMAVLHGQPRTATCRAITPCAIYELKREDFERVAESSPGLREEVERIERKRKEQLDTIRGGGA